MGHYAAGLSVPVRYLETVLIEPISDGSFEVKILNWQHRMLESLIPEIRELLVTGNSPSIRRLFPTAYPNDPDADASYQELVHDELLDSLLTALDRVECNLGTSHLSQTELHQWMQAINSIRLVVGTRLDVSEDDDPSTVLDETNPDRQLWLMYQLLTEMLSIIVNALDS